jgi:hypothetical protein
MLVGEGVFTTRSASEWFELPGWALQSTRNLRGWCPPEGVRRVLIAADRGKDGEASAEILRKALVSDKVESRVALPPAGFGDWNDWACRPDAASSVYPRSAFGRCTKNRFDPTRTSGLGRDAKGKA